MVSALSLGTVAVTAGLLSLERRAFLQAMLSRPLIATALIGLAAGLVGEGPALAVALVPMGAVLELYFLGEVTMGASLSENESFAAIACAACASGLFGAQMPGVGPTVVWTLSVMLALPAARLGRRCDALCDRNNEIRAARGGLHGANLASVWIPFFSGASSAVAALLLGALLLPKMVARLPHGLLLAMPLAWAALTVAAAATAVMAIRAPGTKRGRTPTRLILGCAVLFSALPLVFRLVEGLGGGG